jgi:single-strand DNA-binding protein
MLFIKFTINLIGNVGKTPDLQTLEGNVSVAKLSLATTEFYKDKNGQQRSETEWHTVVLWRGLADLASKYLQKGSLVYVEGKIKNRSYDDKEGIKRTVTEIVADSFLMLDRIGEQKQINDTDGTI